jgi:hypothetical protein
MAATFTAYATGVTFASNKSLLTLFNGVGSGRILRVYRVTPLNYQTAAITGVLTGLELRRVTASSGGSAVTPIKHDTASANLPAQVLCTSGPTDTVTDMFRRALWSADEPSVSAATSDELECLPELAKLWDAGYGDTNIEPITLREGQGLSLRQPGSNAIGVLDISFEFTDSAT